MPDSRSILIAMWIEGDDAHQWLLSRQAVAALRAGRSWKSDDLSRCQAPHIAQNDPALPLHCWRKFHIDNFMNARQGVANCQHDYANGCTQRSEEKKEAMIVMAIILFDSRPELGGVLIRFNTVFLPLFFICSNLSSGITQPEQRWIKWWMNSG